MVFFFFFLILELGNIFENFDQKMSKFSAKKSFFGTFWSKFAKILPNSKIWKKKPFLEKCLKGPYADYILIPQGSTGGSIFFDIKWKPIFFWLQIQTFSFKFFVVLEI